MPLFTIITILVSCAAVLVWANDRINRLPSSIGVMVGGVLIASLLLIAQSLGLNVEWATNILDQVHFSHLLLNLPDHKSTPGAGAILGLLLFATALRIEPTIFRRFRMSIILWLSTAGVVITAFGTAAILYLIIWLIQGTPPAFINVLLFGVILAPTDPVAVIDMLAKSKVISQVRDIVAGEALLNDATSIIMFLVVLALLPNNVAYSDLGGSTYFWITLFGYEIAGGLLTGAVIGFIANQLIRTSRNSEVVALITLAAALCSCVITPALNGSVPLAAVSCGLMIGQLGISKHRTSAELASNVWWVIENALTTIIFLVVGLILLKLDFFFWRSAIYGIVAVGILLLVRFIAVGIPWLFTKPTSRVAMDGEEVFLMTWCGIRGTVSLAMAVAIPAEILGEITHESIESQMLIGTFMVVLVTMLLQGLTLPWVVRLLRNKEHRDRDMHNSSIKEI